MTNLIHLNEKKKLTKNRLELIRVKEGRRYRFLIGIEKVRHQ
jgi:hypothetical protein